MPFAMDHWGILPDIMTTAKGCTSAYTPLGIPATTREVADHFEDHFSIPALKGEVSSPRR